MTPRAKAAADRIAQLMKGKDPSRLEAFLKDPEQRRRFDEETIVEHIASTLRAAIDEGEISRYQIARRTGLTESLLSRIMSGESPNVTIETLAKLCVELDITVTLKRTRKAPR